MIDQNEINELKKKFPNDGKVESRKFTHVIIRKLLFECETLLAIVRELKEMIKGGGDKKS